MGGRGSSSGISVNGKKYGSQYHMLLESENIKFVSKNRRDSEPLMETKTKGRIYAYVGGNEVISIIYFDDNNKRIKQVDLDHPHKGMKPHTHHGYEHAEFDGDIGAAPITDEEKVMIDKVQKTWYNYLKNKR